MKKVFLTVFAVLMVFAASAQFKGGLKAGVNMSKISTDIDGLGSDSENGTSFHVGAYGIFSLSDALAVQPELLYNSIKGSDSETTVNFLSIPVMVTYTFAEKFNVQVGPQYGFVLSSDPSEAKDDLKGDFTLNLGAGASFGKFNVTARYGIGLSNIVDVEGIETKINNFQISLGYQLFGGE
jgi:hypothetical protein